MKSALPVNPVEIRESFVEHERNVRIQNYRVACVLAMIFMPAGLSLDYLVYRQHVAEFFGLRLICSALLFLIWWMVTTRIGSKYYQALGLLLPALPSFFIAWMIYETEGAGSPYYAGLNLVLLGAALVLRWAFWDSVIVFLEVLALYLGACVLHRLYEGASASTEVGAFFNNFYFLFVTGIFVVIGSLFYNRLRFREFALRYELDQNRQQLEQTNEKLREMDQVKSRFFANISHELRTPLTLLIAPLENLINRFGTSLDQPTQQLLATMHSNGMRLLKLINDLLDLVRMESGVMQVKREPVEIAEFLRGLVSAARQMAEDKRIQLQAQVAPEVGTVMVDRDKLEKIVLNLQFNALKFTPAGGRVTIQARQEDDHLVLSVQDTGMGISKENLPNVFSRFWQADDTSRRKYQGMGIGLALVKELTEVQDGRASVDSVEGQGTTFTIELPYLPADAHALEPATAETESESAPAPAPAPAGSTVSNQEWLSQLYRRAEMFPAMTAVKDSVKSVEVARRGNQPTVLVADDEPDMLRFLKSQLEEHYQVFEAVDGQQAIEKAKQFLPDAILLDMMMPEKDGIQACKEIREHTPTASIPVVLITARADEATKMAALSAGASDFLPKPFSTTELHVRTKNLIERYHYQRQLSKQNQVLENTIEQLKETETQLVQTEKLASLGRLSAGIIHEINNPLNFTATGLYTLRNKAKWLAPEQRPDYEDVLKDIEEGVQRVKTIVSDLRSFSHNENDHRSELDVAEVVESALRFLSHEWRDKVRIEHQVPEGLTIDANRNKLIQVLVNLMQNAIDALKDKTFEDEEPTIWIEGETQNGVNTLRIRDNGKGITSQDLDKIFDPFFTTKDVGEGMGLGLSICYRIIQEYDGHVSVKSEPGKFCEFSLAFPVKANVAAA